MTNPNNTVGTNAGYNGRTTPNAFNAVMQLFDASGVLSGWNCRPKSGMTVQIGGVAGTQDVAIAEDNGGNRTAIVNRTATPVEITISGAPATNNRYDTIVAYVNNPQQGTGASDVDFPSQTGIIAVKGTVAANPSYPTEAQIKAAITADGGNGNTAYYVHLADIYVAQGVTSITAGNITQGTDATITDIIGQIVAAQIASNAVTTAKIASTAVTPAKLDLSAMYKSATQLTGDKSAAANTKTNVQNITLPAGKWRVEYLIRGYYTSSAVLCDSWLNDGSNDLIEIAINASLDGSSARFEVIGAVEVTLTGSKTITSQIKLPASGTISPSCHLYATRIG